MNQYTEFKGENMTQKERNRIRIAAYMYDL
jgi:hypothetical protein